MKEQGEGEGEETSVSEKQVGVESWEQRYPEGEGGQGILVAQSP